FLPGAGKEEWFKDLEIGPEMVVVPSGSFLMGSTDNEIAALHKAEGQPAENRFLSEAPQHEGTIPKPFAVRPFPLTFDEWDEAQRDGDWARLTGEAPYFPSDNGWGRGNRPVTDVSWIDAQVYIKWLKGKTGKLYRLLSEAEWEYVCRAGTHTMFWWGDSI